MSDRLAALLEVWDLAADGPDEAAGLARRVAALAAWPQAVGVQQWRAIDDPRVAVVTCDLRGAVDASGREKSAAALASPSGASLRVRYVGEQILPGAAAGDTSAGGLLLLAMDVDPAVEPEFNDWNDTEHFPRLAAVPGVLSARRIRCTGDAQRYLAVYHATEPGIIDSPAWLHARETPWARRIRTFTSRRMRIIGRRVAP